MHEITNRLPVNEKLQL